MKLTRLKLHEIAVSNNIVSYVIQDAGRTQIQSGTITACAFGPGIFRMIKYEIIYIIHINLFNYFNYNLLNYN